MSDQSEFADVGDFHNKFGLYSVTHGGAVPQYITVGTIDFRIKFLCEELQEFLEGVGFSFKEGQGLYDFVRVQDWNRESSDHQMFDALIDLVYVAMGTAHLLGYPWLRGWELVQRANMSKVRAQSAEESKRGSALDVVKPEGWEPPDIEGLLKMYGFPLVIDEGTPDPEQEL